MRETIEVRGRANDHEGRDEFGTVPPPVKAPRGTDEPSIPDYVVWDFARLGEEPVRALYEGGPRSGGRTGGETTTRSRTKSTKRTFGEVSRRTLGRTYWLISKDTAGRMEVLTLGPDGGGTLPVFSHEEEAEMFLGLGDPGDGWRARKSSAGEVISALYGPCAGAKEVALDPLPEMVFKRTMGLVSLPKERFIKHVEDGERFFGSRKPNRRY